jgi:hypothetical protein
MIIMGKVIYSKVIKAQMSWTATTESKEHSEMIANK